MRVHHSGALSQEYFYSYMKLIMSTRASSFEEMRHIVETHFFKGDLDAYGAHTRAQFEIAILQIQHEINQ
ncbi:hypothetical protein JNUCC23_23135 (plasmid) [Peribacillus sp. JNUCC 23]